MYRYRYRAKQTQADADADTDVDTETQPAQGKTGIEQTYTKVPKGLRYLTYRLHLQLDVRGAWSMRRGRDVEPVGVALVPSPLPFVFYFIY